MTIAEKSTELGIDLVQLAIDELTPETGPFLQRLTKDGVFDCFTISKGKKEDQEILIYDDNGVKIHNGFFRYSNVILDENSSLETVEADFRLYLGAEKFKDMPPVKVYIDLV